MLNDINPFNQLGVRRVENNLSTEYWRLLDVILGQVCNNNGNDLYASILDIDNISFTRDKTTDPAMLEHKRLLKILEQGDLKNSVDALINFLSKYQVIDNSNRVLVKLKTSGYTSPSELQADALDKLNNLKLSLENKNLPDLVKDLFFILEESRNLKVNMDKDKRNYNRANTEQAIAKYVSLLSSIIFVTGIGANVSNSFFDISPDGSDLIINISVIISLISYASSWFVFENANISKSVIKSKYE